MRASDLLLLALALGGVAACRDMDGEADAIDTPERPPPTSATATTAPPVATPAFEAMDTGHVTGLVRLYRDQDGGSSFRMEIVLDGLSPGEYRWQIRRGGCDAAEPAVGAGEGPGGLSGSLVSQRADAARAAATVTALTLEEARGGEYALHVSQPSGGDVACADLSGSDNATM
jgi:hypothetical protein